MISIKREILSRVDILPWQGLRPPPAKALVSPRGLEVANSYSSMKAPVPTSPKPLQAD